MASVTVCFDTCDLRTFLIDYFTVFYYFNNHWLLLIKSSTCSTIGERSFQSAAASTWNALSHSVRSSTSVLQFRSRLKTELFARSYQQSLSASVTQHFCSVIKSLDLRHVNDDSNTN